MSDRRKLKGWKRFQPTADDPMKYRVPSPLSTPKEIGGSHGHRPHGKSIRWPALYEHLRRKGYSKAKAAAISNSAWKKKRLGLATNTPTSARGILKSMIHELPVDAATLAILNTPSEEGGLKSGIPPFRSNTVKSITYLSEESNVGTKISKEDLPAEVVEYIEALEEHTDELTEAVEKANAEVTRLTEAGAAADVQKDDADLAVILAKADPAVAAIIQKQDAELKRQADAIAKAAEADTERTMVAKAAALPSITAEAGELADVLKTAYGVSTEYGEKVESILKAANAQVESSALWNELGGGGAQTTIAKSVESQAAELRKADPTLTQEQAIAQVYETNPALYAESLKEG